MFQQVDSFSATSVMSSIKYIGHDGDKRTSYQITVVVDCFCIDITTIITSEISTTNDRGIVVVVVHQQAYALGEVACR